MITIFPMTPFPAYKVVYDNNRHKRMVKMLNKILTYFTYIHSFRVAKNLAIKIGNHIELLNVQVWSMHLVAKMMMNYLKE